VLDGLACGVVAGPVRLCDKKSMTIQEVQEILKLVSNEPADKLNLEQARESLDECVWALRGETKMMPILPGEPTPLVRYELVEAQDIIEQAIQHLDENDTLGMLELVRDASAKLG
jgi:hypothetical protein